MAKKEAVDLFVTLCERVDRQFAVYGGGHFGDPYWKIMKEGCDAVRAGNVSNELKERVEKERGCWGSITSNKAALTLLLEKMG